MPVEFHIERIEDFVPYKHTVREESANDELSELHPLKDNGTIEVRQPEVFLHSGLPDQFVC